MLPSHSTTNGNTQSLFKPPPLWTIRSATSTADYAAAAALFQAYAAQLPVDIAFQNFASELAGLPGGYAPTLRGELLLAFATQEAIGDDSAQAMAEPIGCVALRRFKGRAPDAVGTATEVVTVREESLEGCDTRTSPADETRQLVVGEMKRLYVSPSARGTGLGKGLVVALVDAANRLGYDEVLLDTLPSMAGAMHLYRKVGFVEVQRYYDNPIEGAKFFVLRLDERPVGKS